MREWKQIKKLICLLGHRVVIPKESYWVSIERCENITHIKEGYLGSLYLGEADIPNLT